MQGKIIARHDYLLMPGMNICLSADDAAMDNPENANQTNRMSPLTYLGRYDVHLGSMLPDPRGRRADIKEPDLFIRALLAEKQKVPLDINRPVMILEDVIHGDQVRGGESYIRSTLISSLSPYN